MMSWRSLLETYFMLNQIKTDWLVYPYLFVIFLGMVRHRGITRDAESFLDQQGLKLVVVIIYSTIGEFILMRQIPPSCTIAHQSPPSNLTSGPRQCNHHWDASNLDCSGKASGITSKIITEKPHFSVCDRKHGFIMDFKPLN